MRMKFTTPAAFALTAIFSFASFGAGNAQASDNNWFYNNYDRYEDQAYYGDEYYDEEADEYVVYAPPRRFQRNRYQRNRYQRNRLQRRQDRLRRWAKRQNRKALRRTNRPDRQRLYDARRDGPVAQPSRRQAKKHADKKRRKLAYVPLPRSKPYDLIPSQAPTAVSVAPAPVRKFILDEKSKPQNFDQRPSRNAASVKKDVKVVSVPKATAPAPAKTSKTNTSTSFKPIRIELVKNPKTVEFRQPRNQTKKLATKLASNQLSCEKAKAIVADFGFSSVTARTCTGTIYDFTAKRDGKPYAVKVSSLSGELKGVKKIK